MQRTCRNAWCKQPYEVVADDLAFYDQVSPVFAGKKELIPPPTLCPECRHQKRAMLIPHLAFHERASALSGKRILSIYPESSPFPVYGIDEWWSDGWDPMTYGMPLDHQLPFFQQFRMLLSRVPRMANTNNYCENCDYCYSAGNAKNCFHCAIVHRSEEIYYSEMITGGNSNLMDCYRCQQSQHLYQCWQCISCVSSTFLKEVY
ncbi:MAG: hypothetical protein PHX93_04835 [Candidatus Peribacteraceae bacterium]|jgi:hypothetical protein|nr:hypothetical protein [Candidatus Peribacteraceae bacterium]